jgi:hypothetical protein
MSFPDEQATPPKPSNVEETAAQRVRRRRATRRSFIPTDAEGQASLIADLARRAYPSIELFVLSLACGAILGLGFLLNSQAVLLLGILVAPLMTPWVGFLLAVLTGSPRFLFETVMALLIGGLLVFLGGLLTGFAARLFLPITLDNVYIHSRLWIPALVVIAIGAVTLVASFARSENKPFLPSVIIAYAFYLPINASGFGLGAGLPDTGFEGLLVFGVHFALAGALGLITLFLLRLRPTAGGVILSLVMLTLFAAILFGVAGAAPGSATEAGGVASVPALEESTPPTPTLNLVPTTTGTSSPTNTPTMETPSPVPLTLEITLPPTQTPTITLTPQPTPIYARIQANEGGGANMRAAPGGAYLMTLLNGTIVETYSEFQLVGAVTWVKIYVVVNGQQVEGWVLESTLAYATPAPNFEATSTPTP